jgi:hypothetical protein
VVTAGAGALPTDAGASGRARAAGAARAAVASAAATAVGMSLRVMAVLLQTVRNGTPRKLSDRGCSAVGGGKRVV